nr:unnamed protein product [Haemonchus contortus]
MACKAVHSHLLLGLMILHAIIIEYLFVSDMYLLYPIKVPASSGPKNASSFEEPKLDLNGIKVVVGIGAHIVCLISLIGALLANNISAVARILPPIVVIVILIFTLAFNVPAAICLLLHEAPKHPGGFSRAVRFSMILSFTTIAYSLVVIVVFCVCKPGHESLRPVGGPISSRQQQSRDGDEKRSKEQVEEKRSVERKVKHSSGTSPTENKAQTRRKNQMGCTRIWRFHKDSELHLPLLHRLNRMVGLWFDKESDMEHGIYYNLDVVYHIK